MRTLIQDFKRMLKRSPANYVRCVWCCLSFICMWVGVHMARYSVDSFDFGMNILIAGVMFVNFAVYLRAILKEMAKVS